MKQTAKKTKRYGVTRDAIMNKYGGMCAYTGKPLDSKWQIDHVLPRSIKIQSHHGIEWHNDFRNMLPALAIVNHYKGYRDLEEFRELMLGFHTRLAKLPKKTKREETKRRIKYMNSIAEAFGITKDSPFNGKFYFEIVESL